ncbi:hypothetical protein [Psychroserpens mesophilus]|uniref:hypothetical protein n=1 Tax=Psychroserpens mesophilus TaxID=325473 RepID=UPI003D65F00D
MNTTDFTYILQNPQDITSDQTQQLQELISEFPYAQSARALYLKGLKNKDSFKYNQELKTTAAYTTDRSILFDYITSEAFNQNEISQIIKQNSEHLKSIVVNEADDISIDKSVTIDDALKEHVKNTKGVLDPYLFEEKVKIEDIANFLALQNTAPEQVILDVDAKNIEESPEKTLQIGKPLDFNKSETHSFTEWLKITSFKPINRDDLSNASEEKSDPNSERSDSTITKKFELIDKFLESNPKIIPSKDTPKIELKLDDTVKHDGLMTETLARIYLEQKNYEKAIQSYKILSLKYPEKSGFFADQIKAVKQLQENNI